MAEQLVAEGLSVRHACTLAGLSRRRYGAGERPVSEADTTLLSQLQQLVERHPGWGFWKYYHRLRKDGVRVNHKRLWRLYQQAGLQLPQRRKRALPERERQPLPVAEQANACWSLDFITDALTDGRRFRVLNVLDDFSRRLLGQEIDFSLPARRVTQLLDRLVEAHGRPQQLRCDNGPEFIAHELRRWCQRQAARLHWIDPGKPTQNAFVERFHRSFRAEVLDAELFDTVVQVRRHCAKWQHDYNNLRPHQALKFLTPNEFLFARNL